MTYFYIYFTHTFSASLGSIKETSHPVLISAVKHYFNTRNPLEAKITCKCFTGNVINASTHCVLKCIVINLNSLDNSLPSAS